MKKFLVVLIVGLLLFLGACDSGHEESSNATTLLWTGFPSFDSKKDYPLDSSSNALNYTVDSKEDVRQSVAVMLEEMAFLEPTANEDYPVYFNEAYPIQRDELDFMITNRIFDDPIHLGVLNAIAYLKIISSLLDSSDSFTEDQWIIRESLSQEGYVEDTIYRIIVNEDTIDYAYYELGNDTWIIGVYASVSNIEGHMTIDLSLIAYFLYEDRWDSALRTTYVENEGVTTWQVWMDDSGDFTGLNYIDYSFVDDAVMHLTIDNSEEGVNRKKVRTYDPESGMYYQILRKNDVEDFLYLIQYNENNQYVYKLDRDNDELEFDFNLMLMEGWDQILKDGYSNVLSLEDKKITLPYGVHVDVNDRFGIYIDGYLSSSDLSDNFNLKGTSLVPPITYSESLVIEENVRMSSLTLINSFYEEEYLNVENHLALIMEPLNVDVFFRIASEFISE